MKSTPIYEFKNLGSAKTWTVHHLVNNARATILMANGSGEYRSVFEGDDFDPEIYWLNSNGYSVMRFDKFGCGESKGDWRVVTMDILVQQLVELASQIKTEYPEPLVLIGHSEGAIIGAEAAAISKNLDALILKVPSHQDIKERLKFQLNNSDPSGISYANWIQGIDLIEKTVAENLKLNGFFNLHPKTYWHSRVCRKLTGDVLKEIKIPTFVLNGGIDYYTPQECFNYIHEVIINHHNQLSKAKVYDQVGHSLRKNNENYGEAESDKDIIAWLDDIF